MLLKKTSLVGAMKGNNYFRISWQAIVVTGAVATFFASHSSTRKQSVSSARFVSSQVKTTLLCFAFLLSKIHDKNSWHFSLIYKWSPEGKKLSLKLSTFWHNVFFSYREYSIILIYREFILTRLIILSFKSDFSPCPCLIAAQKITFLTGTRTHFPH